ncbi:mannose-6-phosphate isomerase, class I [Anaerobacillus alkaliphilus]|uniref:Mannose-6-phosphate isomerase n=1 Tax=Anaerobacillus alkaliphilus TaxID=1548597 RepID=A0A4Q0VU33_9BACI|nr:mannose-6-phosphate isomerase, class I [Anaerobacillus alkaliphilus]RXJ02187.1 mannose-6-phosphate isomerase, class I [Anaerobacillus alkaliphilus]
MEPIFLEPVFKERIWGGTKLRDEFNYEIPSEHTGECWGISAHPHGQSIVKAGTYKGMTLGELWSEKPELFSFFKATAFPLLTKILDARTDLSVQVHPDDEYGRNYENGELGKTECWYIIDCEPGAEIIFGHHAQTKQEFINMIENGNWDQLLRRVPVAKGDFFYVPSGTIHAIGAGVMILETQQSSDTTYRVYDYDRLDQDGNKRELHLEKAIDVSTIPHQEQQQKITSEELEGGTVTTFAKTEYFSVYKWDVNSAMQQEITEPFLICSVISGEGELVVGDNSYTLQKGDHFLLPGSLKNFKVKGKLSIIVSHP